MLVHHILGGPSNVTILLADDNEVQPCCAGGMISSTVPTL